MLLQAQGTASTCGTNRPCGWRTGAPSIMGSLYDTNPPATSYSGFNFGEIPSQTDHRILGSSKNVFSPNWREKFHNPKISLNILLELSISLYLGAREKLVGGSIHLKNISQVPSFPQIGVNIESVWNHHPVSYLLTICQDATAATQRFSNCFSSPAAPVGWTPELVQGRPKLRGRMPHMCSFSKHCPNNSKQLGYWMDMETCNLWHHPFFVCFSDSHYWCFFEDVAHVQPICILIPPSNPVIKTHLHHLF